MAAAMMVYARGATGETEAVELPADATVRQLLASLGDRGRGLAVHFAGAPLEESATLADASVCPEAVVDLLPRADLVLRFCDRAVPKGHRLTDGGLGVQRNRQDSSKVVLVRMPQESLHSAQVHFLVKKPCIEGAVISGGRTYGGAVKPLRVPVFGLFRHAEQKTIWETALKIVAGDHVTLDLRLPECVVNVSTGPVSIQQQHAAVPAGRGATTQELSFCVRLPPGAEVSIVPYGGHSVGRT
eukprot:TRINITY_DN55380_c0_g1_i1.p2 TRINITY_DN55380_c0_g1~~TRINITY_DN55380_c0_g1_i1.p2  ORF type:complete len:270 (+),score=53.12 TRINITY_DN55380_c0_g1_i1:87-812(+)